MPYLDGDRLAAVRAATEPSRIDGMRQMGCLLLAGGRLHVVRAAMQQTGGLLLAAGPANANPRVPVLAAFIAALVFAFGG